MNFFTRKVPEDCVFLPIFMDIQQLISYRKMKKITTPQEVMDFLCANKRGKSWGFGIDQENTKKNMENPVSFSL